jgi:hypothetical protein
VTGVLARQVLRWPGEHAWRSIDKVRQSSGRRELTEKDLVIAKRGVARSEIRALSGAGIEDLVALETWPSDSEIVNLT